MTEELEQPTPEPLPQQQNSPVSSEAILVQPNKSNKKVWLIISIVISTLCICSIICLAVFGLGGGEVAREEEFIKAVLDSYMKHMVSKDVESAYALFSPRAQRQIPISELQDLIEGNNYVVFEGYQSLSIQSLTITTGANTNPDIPQGKVATVTGLITYDDNFEGSFNGTLEKVNNNWEIDGMFITVPPNKLQP